LSKKTFKTRHIIHTFIFLLLRTLASKGLCFRVLYGEMCFNFF